MAISGTNFTRHGANARDYSMATTADYRQAQAWYGDPYFLMKI